MTVSIELVNLNNDRLSAKHFDSIEHVVNEPINPVKFLGIDPGKANGIVLYDGAFRLVYMMTVHADDMVRFLSQFKFVHTVIIEDYRLYPNKAHKQIYSDMETSRVIGRIEAWAETQGGIRVIKQGSNILDNAFMWLGQKPPGKSNPRRHIMCANAHFVFWAVKQGHIKVSDLL